MRVPPAHGAELMFNLWPRGVLRREGGPFVVPTRQHYSMECDGGLRARAGCLSSGSIARGFIDKCVEGVDSPALEHRDIHPGDDRGGSLGAELPEQSAVVVIH